MVNVGINIPYMDPMGSGQYLLRTEFWKPKPGVGAYDRCKWNYNSTYISFKKYSKGEQKSSFPIDFRPSIGMKTPSTTGSWGPPILGGRDLPVVCSKFQLVRLSHALGILAHLLRIVMEPKNTLRLGGDWTPRSSTDKVSQDPYRDGVREHEITDLFGWAHDRHVGQLVTTNSPTWRSDQLVYTSNPWVSPTTHGNYEG